MTLLASLIFFMAALLVAGLAMLLFLRAGNRLRQEDVLLRLRAAGADDPESLRGGLRESRIRNPLVRAVCHVLWRTGAEADAEAVQRSLWVALILVPLTLMLFGVIAGVLILLSVSAVVYFLLLQRAVKRRNELVGQLPGYLESVIRVLSAGNTLDEALTASAREAPEPTRTMFLSVGRQVRLGAPVEDVLAETAAIHRLRDIKVLALAAAINRKYGGSLRNILKSLIGAIRARDVANRELRALTAETRFSAWVLALIPALLTVYIYVQNQSYYKDMWADGSGRGALMLAMVLQITGIFTLFRMMRGAEMEDA